MFKEISAKSVLQKSRLPESPYCINPYVGCTHSCVYCYARFMRRFTGHKEKWGSFVDIKSNAPILLAKQLDHIRVPGSVLIGSVCDAYQPIEKKYRVTRGCVEQLVSHSIPFSILTKSSLVIRDIDLFLQATSPMSVGFSISMLDDATRKVFEPGASAITERIQAMKLLHDAGIMTYAFIGPILPLITKPTEIVNIISPFVDEVWGEVLNMRCGNKEDLTVAYQSCGISREWERMINNEEFWIETEEELRKACESAGKQLIGFYQHN